MDPKRLTGACLCGVIAYELTAMPGDVADICHCAQCRRASGAASLPWVQVPPARFRITRGVATAYASSPRATRWFCGACGTPLYMTDHENRSVGITLGTLDQPEQITPSVHGWLCERIAWEALDDILPRYDKAPPYDL
ncbi:GFA family protein [Acidocella sp.]|uniref:GFA family protein n=1 Tax=Acidocella sp. TaxID=50710 RepID=UPI0026279348|nr:GFA family protein [Acidocella sp.]